MGRVDRALGCLAGLGALGMQFQNYRTDANVASPPPCGEVDAKQRRLGWGQVLNPPTRHLKMLYRVYLSIERVLSITASGVA
jgi:hypothetical protein